jgi:predicted dehydrogenase
MAPIRTALIGLSSTAKTSWASSAHLPYLLSARGRERYQIVALLNSSADAARAAIAVYDLDPATTRAYGKPEDLAADPDVDLVVCCTRVDVHFDSAWASVAAGKAAYIEWPLAQDAAHARELTLLAKEKGARSIIGLQGRLAPPVRKLKEVIASGRIGTVLSVELRAFGGTNAADILPRGLDYFLRKETGGNIYTIVFAHGRSYWLLGPWRA